MFGDFFVCFILVKQFMFKENKKRSSEIEQILKDNSFLKDEMAIAIIDLREENPEIFGYNLDTFIYPASVYKIFIAAEVLRLIENGSLSLEQKVVIKSPNDVDRDARIFPGDTRKLLFDGDEVTIDYLLDLMLTRSDNTASNTLIDLVGRESITENIIYKYNWHGSEVTRKFLDRKKDATYQNTKNTLSCVRHLADFLYLVEKEKLISPFVSKKLKEYMLRFNRLNKKFKGLYLTDIHVSYYGKGGWLENNLYSKPLSALKAFLKKGWTIVRWSNDVGVMQGQNSHYVIAVLSVHKTIFPNSYFDIKKLARVVHEYMES